MNLNLEGKNAVVCGSSQGIGLAIAIELAQLGANCILLARNAAALGSAIEQLRKSTNQHHSFAVADFTKPQEVQDVITNIIKRSPVHILINNTGGPAPGPVIEAEEEEFARAFQQHLICNHLLAKAVVPSMRQEGYGRIINIISTTVKIPLNNLGVSNTVRGAVASWAKTMANELGQYQITVNNVLPGFTETERLKSLVKDIAEKRKTDIETVAAGMKADIPVRRFGQPSEVAAVAAFLASPAAAFINGASIPVDGGRTGSI